MTIRPEDVTRLDPVRQETSESSLGKQSGQGFNEYMQQAAQKMGGEGAHSKGGVSPFDLSQSQNAVAAGGNLHSVLQQAQAAQVSLGNIADQLNTPNLKLKQSQRYLLKNKLDNANTNIRSVSTKLGLEPQEVQAPESGGILGKFLGFVGQGQSNLAAVQQQISQMSQKGANLQPADFLHIQVKMAHAQQEIEYASIMLSKAVEDMKTLFNVQL